MSALEVLSQIVELNLEKEHSDETVLDVYRKILFFREWGGKIEYVNDEVFDIILNIPKDSATAEKFKVINWDDLKVVERFKSKKPRIYFDFINFIKKEFGLKTEEDNIFVKKEFFNINEKHREVCRKYNVKIINDFEKKPGKVTVSDFILYFNRRLDYFYNLLSKRVNVDKVVGVSSLSNFPKGDEIAIIGLVNEIRETKKGYVLEIEDKTGVFKCFVNKDKNDLVTLVKNLTLDEGVCMKGKLGDNILWVDEIVIPTPSNIYESKKYDKDVYVLFLSDIHFGAKMFMDNAFQKFIDFINEMGSNERLNEIASKVKYIFIVGDIIEGIGIYPDQSKDVRIISSELQYHEAARWLAKIPEDKCIIIVPGNHDTCRLSEPQPRIPYEKAYPLYHMRNTLMLSNPSLVNILQDDNFPGFDIYMYHGGSLFYYGSEIQHLREKGGVKNPNEIVKFLLEKRHLAPSHGSTLYYPDNEMDPLVIRKLPDFFLTGHTHKLGISKYKKTIIVSCGCWVGMSDYQEKQGMIPDPAKVVLYNLRTMKPLVLNFFDE